MRSRSVTVNRRETRGVQRDRFGVWRLGTRRAERREGFSEASLVALPVHSVNCTMESFDTKSN